MGKHVRPTPKVCGSFLSLGPDSRKASRLISEILVSNLRFFSDLRPFAQLGFTKDLRLRFGLKSKTA